MFAGKDFLNMKPPPNYKPGVGRGATGFTTRADLAPLTGVPDPTTFDSPSSQFQDADSDVEKGTFFNRASSKLLLSKSDADEEGVKKHLSQLFGIATASEFDQLERDLATIKAEDWANIPPASDFTRRNKRLRREEALARRTFAIPDSVLLKKREQDMLDNTLNGPVGSTSDHASPILGEKIEAVDRHEYLKELESAQKAFLVEEKNWDLVHDPESTRKVLETAIKDFPTNSQPYIGLARLEERQNRLKEARKIISSGSLHCENSTDVWLESIRLHPTSEARAIASKALSLLPHELQLWKAALKLEKTVIGQRQVVHKALEYHPTSVELWLKAAELESDDRDLVLRQALELVPESEELWLALDSSLEEAQAALPNSRAICIARAVKAEQAGRNGASIIDAFISKHKDQSQDWVQRALTIHSKAPQCARAILRHVQVNFRGNPKEVRFLLESVEKSKEMYDYWAALEQEWGNLAKSSAVLEQAVAEYPDDEQLWIKLLSHDATTNNLSALIDQAIANAPTKPVYFALGQCCLRAQDLNRAIEMFKCAGDLGREQLLWALQASGQNRQANDLMQEFLCANSDVSIGIYLEGARIAASLDEDPRKILDIGLQKTKNPRIFIALAEAEEYRGQIIRARALLNKLVLLHPKYAQGWYELVRFENRQKRDSSVVLNKALQACPRSGILWWEMLKAAPETARKQKLAEALKVCGRDGYVLAAMALMHEAINGFVSDRLKEAVDSDPDNGDLWMWYYRSMGDSCIKSMERANPKKGVVWSALRSNPKNWHKNFRDLLLQNPLENPFI